MKKRIILSTESLYIHDLMYRITEAFASGEGELLYDKRNKIRRFTLEDGSVVIVKQYKKPNFFQRICYSTFWNNKAKKSYFFGNMLLNLGIDTPRPIAAVTYYNNIGMENRYYFASTEDSRPDCLILRDGNMDNPQPMIDALSAYLIHLHELGFLHGDTNLSNFLYSRNADGSFSFSVIDTNRSRFLGRPANKKEALSNLIRLTHKRSLLCEIITSYALQHGWNVEEAVKTVFHLIEKREKRKNFLHLFKWFPVSFLFLLLFAKTITKPPYHHSTNIAYKPNHHDITYIQVFTNIVEQMKGDTLSGFTT